MMTLKTPPEKLIDQELRTSRKRILTKLLGSLRVTECVGVSHLKLELRLVLSFYFCNEVNT